MKIQFKILLVSMITTILFVGLLNAEERDREGAFAGIFLTRAEHWLGDRQHLAIIVKPHESDDRVTILVPRNDDFMHVAQEIREGDNVEIGFVREDGQKWLKRIKIERLSKEHRPPEEAHRRELDIHRRELLEKAHNLKRELEGLRDGQDQEAREIQAHLHEINQQIKNIDRELKGPEHQERRLEKKEFELMVERPKIKKPPLDHKPQIAPLMPHKEPPIEEQINSIRIQLKEAFAHQLQKMREQLKEVIGDRLERMTGGFEELSIRVDKLEKELRDLRAENQRLRNQLEERRRPTREPDKQERPLRRDSDERREEQRERELIQQRQADRDRAEREERRPPEEGRRDDNN